MPRSYPHNSGETDNGFFKGAHMFSSPRLALSWSLFVSALISGATLLPQRALAEKGGAIERASGERLATAVGHYARSRTLLLSAIKEFDEGMREANANTLLDASRFRATLINRVEELERVLDPQPRVTKTGIKYSGDTRLMGEAQRNKAR